MELDLLDISDIEKGKPGLVLGHGPSWGPDAKFVEQYLNESDAISLTTGEAHKVFPGMNFNIDLDYWSIANSVMRVDNSFRGINEINPRYFLYANSVDYTEHPEELLKVNFIKYDQRHFPENPCGAPCCQMFGRDYWSAYGKSTIQEFLQRKAGHSEHYSSGDTAILHTIATALIIGCNPIYLLGIDLSYKHGYIGKTTTQYDQDGFSKYMPNILNDFKILNDTAERMGVKIYNCSLDSPLKNIFETKTVREIE